MTIDIKWLLYRYHSIKQAKDTADAMMHSIKFRESHDPNWWIHGKGGLPNSRTESTFFSGVTETDRATQLQGYIIDLTLILTAVDSAVRSLKRELHDLIQYRYIDDLECNVVAEKMNLITDRGELNLRKYYRLHNIALEGMNIGCMPLNFIFDKDSIEIMLGKLGVRKIVSNVSQNRVESVLLTS